VELPFLEIDQELWDPEFKRLTVLFDPGRIKRGVKPLVDIGAALEAGKRYTLVVEPGWLDGAGAALKEEFRKAFDVVAEDRTPPDHKTWRIRTNAKASAPVVVEFPEPLDYAMLHHSIRLKGPHGIVPARVEVGEGERSLSIIPTVPLEDGHHLLMINTAIEDLAGNRIGRPFDVDTFERVSERIQNAFVSLPFEIRNK
jgi:hypothetical protein